MRIALPRRVRHLAALAIIILAAAFDAGGGGPTPIDGGELTIAVNSFAVLAIN